MSKIQAQFLAFVWACDTLGANFWGLADFIYPNDQCDLQFTQMRVKELLKRLRKEGFDLQVKDNKIFYPPEPGTVFLLPMNFVYQGPAAHFACFFETFSRSDLQNFYKLPRRTAIHWMNDWYEKGLLFGLGSKNNQQYQFKDELSK